VLIPERRGEALCRLFVLAILAALAGQSGADPPAAPDTEHSIPPAPTEPATGAVLEVNPPTVVFEELYAGATGESEVSLRNGGSQTLVIESVKAGCGCTGVLLGEKRLEPGQSTPLKVSFRSADKDVGHPVRKVVTIHSNDPRNNGQYRLDLVAHVKAGVIVNPLNLNLGEISPGEEQNPTVHLEAEDGEPFRILQASVSDPKMTLHYDQNVESNTHSLKLRFVPEDARQNSRAQLTIQTNHPKRSQIQVPVYWRISRPVTVRPAYLALGRLDPGADVQRSVELVSRLPEPLADVRFRVEGAPITVLATQSLSSPSTWDLTLHVPQQLAGERVRARLVVDTSDKRARDIVVALTAEVTNDINLMPDLPGF